MSDTGPACGHCGASLGAEDAFCLNCGTPTGVPMEDLPPDPLTRLRVALTGRYTIERELGRGGMATVYLANDVRHERRVAIKVLHPELAASVGGDRFVREIRVAAKLQHPHILTLYDSGDADGLLYYVMPFVEGESLRDRLTREKMLPVDEALGLVIEVAEALGYAHSQGIVHRDIKPENILLSNGHALVADFGIARAISAAEEHKLTQTGSAVGTPVYMSPEQAMGDEVGPTSDIYSLACVAFELLTGEPPFTGVSARAIMARHTMEMPPSIRLVRETVPEEVEETILWALAKVVADRPKDANAFIEALATPLAATASRRSLLRSRMTTAPRLTGVRRAYVPLWRRPPVIAAAAVVLLLGGVGAWKLAGGGKARTSTAGGDARSLAVLYFADESPSHDLGYLADGLTDGLIDRLRDVRELHVVSSGGSGQFKGSTVPDDSIARALAVGALVRGSIEPEGNEVKVSVRLIDGASGDVLQRATFRRPIADPLTLADTLAVEVARLVRSQLGTEIQLREQREKASSPQAWVLVRRAERLRQQMDSLGRASDTTGMARAWAQGDTLLAEAEATDPDWVQPIIQRGTLAYRRSRLADSPTNASPWIETGLTHANRAVAKDGRDANALELRGNLRYWKYLNGLETDPTRAGALLASAQADLEQATQVNPGQAGAWASLSHLYYRVSGKSGVDINLAARKAMEEDAYLSNADVILSRLFLSSYDLLQFSQARQWCDEGLRRFPLNWRFTECRLMMLTTRDVTPDIPAAWRYADSMLVLTSPSDMPFNERSARLFVAAVLARVPGRADSARRVAARSLGDAEVDPSRDLALRAAFVYGVLADTSAAINQLKIYLNANPSQRQAFADDPGWWLRPIQDTPAFRQLVGLPSR